MKLRSPAFEHNGEIPTEYTRDGARIAPPPTWRGMSDKTRGPLLIEDAPDASDPAESRRTRVHCVSYEPPPAGGGRPGACAGANLPVMAAQGLNDRGSTVNGGPCPFVDRRRCFHRHSRRMRPFPT